MKNYLLFLILLLLGSCIGTDEVEDPIIAERIETSRSQIGLLLGDTTSVSAQFYDHIGQLRSVNIQWVSQNPGIASVSAEGLVTALAAGQSNLMASVGATASMNVLVTVVASAQAVANVTISIPSGNQIAVGSSVALNTSVTTLSGEPAIPDSLDWYTSDGAILSIAPDGLLSGISAGTAQVYALADGVQSNTLSVTVGSTSREGTFQGAGGYATSGMATLSIDEAGQLILTFSSNFSTDFALGTFVYLSNTISGSGTRNNGLELAEISSGGAKTFNVSTIDPSVGLNDYSHVIILCKPASITFGFAPLN